MAALEPLDPELKTEYRIAETPRHLGVSLLEPTWYATVGKRIFDLVVGSLLAVVLLPLLALSAVVVLLSVGRPMFYRQVRVGAGGRPFRIIKFRTMTAEPVIDLTDSRVADGPVGLVVDTQNRTTRATRLLRRLSLDELPQIFNVLRGEMSLVGPRPEVWALAAEAGLINHARNQVKPGMTGLWQISPERRGEIADGVQLDLDYVASVSLRTDLAVLLRTPMAVLASNTE